MWRTSIYALFIVSRVVLGQIDEGDEEIELPQVSYQQPYYPQAPVSGAQQPVPYHLSQTAAPQPYQQPVLPVGTTKPGPGAIVQGKRSAPANCKLLPTDAEWPLQSVWDKDLPGWELIPRDGKMKHPQVIYNAVTVQAVQRAVSFAARHNIRLSIYNSGHDFLGRNDAPSGILLNIKGLRGARVLPSFTPTTQGAKPVHYRLETNTIQYRPGAAVTFGAGMNTEELNAELGKSGMWTIGPAHAEVSVAGGWSQAGGHATLSHYYGLGADNVLEYKVVTSDGNLTIANAESNRDLYWALRGGGAGTWGVVVESTFKAYSMPTVLNYNFFLNTTDYNDRYSIFAPAAYLASHMPRLVNEGGISGYIYLHPNAIRAQLYAVNEYASADRMKALLEPILDGMARYPGIDPDTLYKYPPFQGTLSGLLNGDAVLNLPPIPMPGAMSLGYNLKPLEPWFPGKPAGLSGTAGGAMNLGSLLGGESDIDFNDRSRHQEDQQVSSGLLKKRHGPGETLRVSRGIQPMDSRLFGAEELTSPKLAEALRKSMPFTSEDGQIRFHLVAGPRTWAQGQDTSVNPAWRRTYAHLLATGSGQPNVQSLRDLSPNSGAYFNEAWNQNPNFKQTFWGANYDKLAEIKSRWDPNMVFYVTPGINADLMIADGDRLCRVQGAPPNSATGAAPLGDNRNVATHFKDYISFPQLFDMLKDD